MGPIESETSLPGYGNPAFDSSRFGQIRIHVITVNIHAGLFRSL
jgi:hypothetical protein